MSALQGFLIWMRCAQTQTLVNYCEARVHRAKVDLHNALEARDIALAHARIHDHPPTVPAFLLKEMK
jgi:hypothetical protein